MAEVLINFIVATAANAVINAIFPTKIEQPRLGQLRAQRSEYGAFIPRAWGPHNRLAGNVIYSSGLQEKKIKQKSKGKGKQQVTSYTYSASVGVLIVGNETSGLRRIWANGRLIFDRDGTSWATPIPAPTADIYMEVGQAQTAGKQVWSRISYYAGTATQMPNAYLQSVKGAADTPAYRHSSYVVIEGLQLADFGNVIPNFEFDIIGDESITMGEIVREIAENSGVSGSMGVVGVAGTPAVDGFMFATGGSSWDAVKPLLAAYGYNLADHGGQLRLQRRGRGMRGVIDPDTIGGGVWPAPAADIVLLDRMDDRELPKESTVTFLDIDRDMQPNSVMSSRLIGVAESKAALDVPLVFRLQRAAELADLALYETWAERRGVKFKGSRRHDEVMPGDVWGIPTPTRVFAPYRIIKRRESPNGEVEFDGVFEDPEAYDSNRPPVPASIPINVVQETGDTNALLLDAPMLALNDDDTGFYWAGAGEVPGWRGGLLFRSSDAGETWMQAAGVGLAATMGTVAVATPSQRVDVWDRVTVITVVLDNEGDELESVSAGAVLNGANACWIGNANGRGGEVLQFQTATLVAPKTYQLSNLLRGRRGTDHATGTHGTNERFLLIEPDTLRELDYGQNDWNRERTYKPVSLLQDIDDVAAQTFTNTGERKRPFSPVHLRGDRNGSLDLDVSWTRRTRVQAPDFGGGPAPIGENNGMVFSVGLYNGATLVRTKVATFSPTYQGQLSLANSTAGVYTAAEQTADGITPGAAVRVAVRQQSDYVTDGHVREAVL